MKAAVFLGKNNMVVREEPMPVPNKGEVVVKVMACGVCGTDLHIMEGAKGSGECNPPRILGHEFSGIVYALGEDVNNLAVGDRVCVDPNDICDGCYQCLRGKGHFCEHMVSVGVNINGGFAQYSVMRAKQCYKLEDTISFEEAAMCEPVACCLHGLDLTQIKPGDNALIIGGGTIGLIMLQLVKNAGASRIALVDPISEKQKLALSLGADYAFGTEADLHQSLVNVGMRHIDACIECVGLGETMKTAIEQVSRGGTVMMFGLTHPDCEIPIKPFDIFKREINITASFINPYTQRRALSLIESGRINVRQLITDEISLDDINKVFDDPSYRKRGKILIKPNL